MFTIRGSLRARVSAYKSPIKPPLRRCLFPKFRGVFRGIFKIYRTSPGDPYCFVDCSKPSPPKCVPRLLSVSLSPFFRSSQPSRTNGTSISFFLQTTKKSDYFQKSCEDDTRSIRIEYFSWCKLLCRMQHAREKFAKKI